MRPLLLLLTLLLTACASYQADEYGNYLDVTLTPTEQVTIAQDIGTFLRQTDTAAQIINLNHDNSTFATTLMATLRELGLGVAQDQDSYLNLNYRVEALNHNQFYVTASLSDGRHFSRIWLINNDRLVPLPVRTTFAGGKTVIGGDDG